jgi:hypothetical protein
MLFYLECLGWELLGVPFWQSELIGDMAWRELTVSHHRVLSFLCTKPSSTFLPALKVSLLSFPGMSLLLLPWYFSP